MGLIPSLDATAYRRVLQALLPEGTIWPREEDADLTKLLAGLAEESARADERMHDLIDEADPRTSVELLPDWERVCGLPDVCSEIGENLAERRQAVVAKLTAQMGLGKPHLIALAAALGYEVTITEFTPARAGTARAGDPVYSEEWAYVFRMRAAETAMVYARAGSAVAGDRIRSWSNERLECRITEAKAAHTLAIFAYGGTDEDTRIGSRPDGAFSMAFSRDFDTVRGADIPRAGAFNSDFGRDFDIKRRGAFSQAFSKDFDTLS